MSRCAHGTSPAKRCRNSAAVMRAGPAVGGGVDDVGVAALDQLRVVRVQRHAPDELARALRRRRAISPRPGVVVGEQARVGAAERDDDRAGQRREVDEALGAEVERVGEAVGQHEPALGVGVVDLDRHAGLGAHDVAGLHRVRRRAGSRSRRSRPRRGRAAPARRSRRRPRARRRRRTCRTSSRASSRRA